MVIYLILFAVQALQSVLAEEEHLTDELVKENEAALAEVCKEEQTYLQEIQRVEQDAADDDDLMVSTFTHSAKPYSIAHTSILILEYQLGITHIPPKVWEMK